MSWNRRVAAFCSFALHSSRLAARVQGAYDVVLATSTPLTVALPALAACRAGVPVVFEVRDVWPDAAIDIGVLRNPLLIAWARALEKRVYARANHVVPLSSGMRDRLLTKGVPESKMTVLPNCADLDLFDPAKHKRDELRRQLGAEGKFVILYVGAMNLANDMPFLVSAMRFLKDLSDIAWWFVGDGTQADVVKRGIQEYGIANVKLWGNQAKADVPRYIAAADVGVVSFVNRPVYYENSPNKFFDYCAGALPCIFTRTTWLGPHLEHYDAGCVCADNSPDEFSRFVKRLKEDGARRQEMGENARCLAETEFARDVIARQYLDLLKGVSAEGEAQKQGPSC